LRTFSIRSPHPYRPFASVFLLICFYLEISSPFPASGRSKPSRKISVLILTGQNNHDWKATTPVLKRILESSGRFIVTVTDHPEKCTAQSLKPYDVILSNWNTYGGGPVKTWPAAARDGIINFVRSGKGFVVVHAGSSSFYDWKEYQQMVAATWRNGVTWHAPKHLFYVHITDPSQPITHGMRIFVTDDELWNNTVVQPGVQSLASGYSDKSTGGSGNDEPILFVRSFGKGRTCALMLGHDAAAMSDLGFQTLLRRGTEWAATGRVTIPVPNMALTPKQLDFVLKGVASYVAGDRRDPLWMLQYDVGQVAGTSQAELTARKLAQLVNDPHATAAGRQFACGQLALIGTARQAPILAGLLNDKTVAFQARAALEIIPGPAALSAMRKALLSSSGEKRLGLISALAARRDILSIPVFKKLALTSDPKLVSAAVTALGDMGDPASLSALKGLAGKLPKALRRTYLEALLHDAVGLFRRGDYSAAYETFKNLSDRNTPLTIRTAALYDRIGSSGKNSTRMILHALKSSDPLLRSAAIRYACLHYNEKLMREALTLFGRMPKESKTAILHDAAAHGMIQALPLAFRECKSPYPPLRQAAISALGELGDASAVEPLIREGIRDASLKTTIMAALEQLRGASVNRRIVSLLPTCTPLMQEALLNVLVERNAKEETHNLLKLSSNPNLRMGIVHAVGELGGVRDCQSLIQMLQIAGDSQREDIAQALGKICSRAHTLAPLVKAFSQSAGVEKVALIGAIASVGGPDALPPLKQAALFPDPLISIPAINALSSWNDASSLEPLCKAYEAAYTDDAHALALRGIVQVAPLTQKGERVKSADLIANLLKNVSVPEDRNTLLSVLGKLPCLEAFRVVNTYLRFPATSVAAERAALNIAQVIGMRYPDECAKTVRLLESSLDNEIRTRATSLMAELALGPDLALEGVASHPDGLYRDGQASGAQAAIDGDPNTYWDETDNQKLYVLQVQWKKPISFNYMRIMGYAEDNYAPKDFDIVCDGKLVKSVTNAVYVNNLLTLHLPDTQCSLLQLRITGYYGNSPAIRELELYHIMEGGK